jgi:hypothetical protein
MMTFIVTIVLIKRITVITCFLPMMLKTRRKKMKTEDGCSQIQSRGGF